MFERDYNRIPAFSGCCGCLAAYLILYFFFVGWVEQVGSLHGAQAEGDLSHRPEGLRRAAMTMP